MKCKRCGSTDVVFLSDKLSSIESVLRRIYMNPKPAEPVHTYKCNRCGDIFQTKKDDGYE